FSVRVDSDGRAERETVIGPRDRLERGFALVHRVVRERDAFRPLGSSAGFKSHVQREGRTLLDRPGQRTAAMSASVLVRLSVEGVAGKLPRNVVAARGEAAEVLRERVVDGVGEEDVKLASLRDVCPDSFALPDASGRGVLLLFGVGRSAAAIVVRA